jgi:hypothetical protein
MKRSAAPSKAFKVPWKTADATKTESTSTTSERVPKKKKTSGESPLKPKVFWKIYLSLKIGC